MEIHREDDIPSHGWMGRRLWVDLTDASFRTETLSGNYCRSWIGGRGFNTEVINRLARHVSDPFDPANPVCFAPGPLTGILSPLAGKTVVSTLPAPGSPGQGEGRFQGHAIMEDTLGALIKGAGFDQLILTGRSKQPVVVYMDNDTLRFLDASALWGLGTAAAASKIASEIGDLSVKSAVIGPAGENRVPFSTLVSSARPLGGAAGIGAVLGAKNLKGIAVHGSIPVPVADPRGLVESHGVFIDSLCRPNPSLLDRVERNLACADPDAEELWEKEVRFLRLKRIACWSCQISCRRVVLGRAGGSGFHCSIPEMLDLLRAYSGNGGLGTEDVVTLAALCADLGLDAAAAGRSAKLRPGDSGWERESIARWFEETARGGGGGLGPSGLPGNEDREPGGDDSVLILDMAGACRQAHCFWKGWEVWERGIAPIFEQATGVSLGAADVEEICTRVREAEGELRRPGTGTGDRA